MDLTLTADEELLATTARRFLEDRAPLERVRTMVAGPSGYSPELWREMAALGWLGAAFPVDEGGSGGSFLDLCLVIEQLGRSVVPSPFVGTVVLCGLAIARHGDPVQRASRLPSIGAGELVMSYVRAAPGSGWDGRGSTVTARRVDGAVVLDGEAMLVPYAAAADELMVVAEWDGRPGVLGAFLVPGDAPGLSTEPLDTVLAGGECRVVLAGVELGPGALLGSPEGGAQVAAEAEALGAAATCASMVGGAQRVLDMTVAYAADRQQFGVPVGSFQAVQHRCADMSVDVLTSRLIAFEAIWRLSEGFEGVAEVSMAKAWVSEAYQRVCDGAHQVHGAIGFTAEHDLHLFFRHAMGTALAFGDGDHHYRVVAHHLGLD